MRDLGLLAEDRLFEFDGEVVAKSRPFCTRDWTAMPPPMLNISPKRSPKMSPMSWAPEGIAIEARCAEAGVAVAIIGGALLRVAEHLIGLAALLESLFGFVVARIAVGMMLQGQLAIGRFQLLIGRGAGNA